MYTRSVTEITTRDFRANIKEYLDRVEAGEIFTVRDGAIHIAANASCQEHLAEDAPMTLFDEYDSGNPIGEP